MDKKTRKQIADQAIGAGALSQLSRNRKINNLGWLFVYIAIMTYIGEILKFIIKWCIVKPFIFSAKIIWICFRYILMFSGVLFLTISQYTYKGIKMLNEKYKEKKQV